MPPTMMTRSAGQPAAASRGGGTGGRVGSGGGRTRGHPGDQVPDFSTIIAQQLMNLLPTIVAQVCDQGRGQGNGRNQNGDAVNDNIQGDVSRGCTYKEFLACNLKEYDGKGGAIVYTHWIKKMESVHDISGCRDSQRVKYTAGSFVDKALMWWNSDIRTRGREAIIGMSWEDFKTLTREEFCPSNEMQKLETELRNHAMVGVGHAAYTDSSSLMAATKPKTIQKAVQLAGTLTNEAHRNGSIKKNPEKRGNVGEPSKDMNGREDNKRTRTGNAFATTANPVRGCYIVARTYFECGSTDHIKSACPRINQAQRLGGNQQNQVVAVNGGQGRGNQGNQARGKAFILGAEEAR
ncbi:hypothetical protein Tco_0561547 [Tanacetum coccineum]